LLAVSAGPGASRRRTPRAVCAIQSAAPVYPKGGHAYIGWQFVDPPALALSDSGSESAYEDEPEGEYDDEPEGEYGEEEPKGEPDEDDDEEQPEEQRPARRQRARSGGRGRRRQR
jgi:hypothetical protein